jgi:hypothetical protein
MKCLRIGGPGGASANPSSLSVPLVRAAELRFRGRLRHIAIDRMIFRQGRERRALGDDAQESEPAECGAAKHQNVQ